MNLDPRQWWRAYQRRQAIRRFSKSIAGMVEEATVEVITDITDKAERRQRKERVENILESQGWTRAEIDQIASPVLDPDLPPHKPPCPHSSNGRHCVHWANGDEECCFCGLEAPEENDPVRREGGMA